MSAAEVTQMLDAATSGGTTLMVNNCRRLFPSYRRVHELLGSGECGAIENVRISDGSPFEWNSVSDFYLTECTAGQGSVFGPWRAHRGCCLLVAAGRPQVIDARYDALGGAEALMNVQMALGKTAVQLAFSRFYKLENCYTVECEKAQIRGRLFNSTKFEIVRNGQVESIQAGKPALYHEYAWQLLENFIEVVQDIAPPLFTAADVAPSIALIDETYQQATPFDMPWYENDPNLALLRSQAMTHNP